MGQLPSFGANLTPSSLKGLEPAARYAVSATSGGLANQTLGGVASYGR
jgi:hypothetical protein